jgi:hypothetical protein
MIDQEYWREHHKKEFEIEWMEKNKEAVLHTLRKADNGMGNLSDNSGIGSLVMDVMAEPEQEFRQMVKDRRLARTNPRQYCADRCIAAGYCDVYEDLYVNFCVRVVLRSHEYDKCLDSNHMFLDWIIVWPLRFHYTPEEVVAFCKNCVLTSDGESCNIPDEVFDKAQLMP